MRDSANWISSPVFTGTDEIKCMLMTGMKKQE